MSLFGAAASAIGLGVLVAARSSDDWAWAVATLSVLAVIGLADAAIITRRMRR